MKLPQPLIEGTLIERYKRFLVDIAVNGHRITAHCADSGRMSGLLQPGNPVLLSKSDNPGRKLPFTWELVQVGDTWVGVNTMNPNRIVHEALRNYDIPELTGYSEIKNEVTWAPGCRFDFSLKNGKTTFVEVKNVTLAKHGVALFPDAVTQRGTKHLNHLIEVVRCNHRAVMFFLVHRGDCHRAWR